MSNTPERRYRSEADYLLRENMNKLKGLIDLLCLGVLDSMNEKERQEFFRKMQTNMNGLYDKLVTSVNQDS